MEKENQDLHCEECNESFDLDGGLFCDALECFVARDNERPLQTLPGMCPRMVARMMAESRKR